MRGTFYQGDILLVDVIDLETVRPGDVIAFQHHRLDSSVTLVAHRVQSKTATTLITRGDMHLSPDPEPVCSDSLIGRIGYAQRDGKTRRIWGGRAGRLWASALRLYRRITAVVGWPYHLLRSSGLVRRLWRPRVVQLRLATEDGPLVKFVHGQRTAACWWPEQGRFWCRKPYDLVIERPAEPGGQPR